MSSNETREKLRPLWLAYHREQDPKRKKELRAEFKKARDEMFAIRDKD